MKEAPPANTKLSHYRIIAKVSARGVGENS